MGAGPTTSGTDLVDEYRGYLKRFDAKTGGSVDFGKYVKHDGRMVKKLTYDEFEKKWSDFHKAKAAYEKTMERGDTINDVLVKLMREGAAELFVELKW